MTRRASSPWILRTAAATTLRIGSAPQYENSWQYAQLDGDTRLLSVSRGLAEECYVTRGSLHSVEQLTIHADRLDEITLLNAEGEITQQWRLNGAITNADAQDRWMLTTPVSYPADGTAMNTLRKSAANIRPAVNAAIVQHIIHQIAFLLADDEGDRGFRVIGPGADGAGKSCVPFA